jgi:AraC-like DNA-binding protein
MIRINRPAVDSRIASTFGVSKSGQPLSYNRAPAADLADWIGRLSVSKLTLHPGQTLDCGLFADTAGVRIQLIGVFDVETAAGIQHHELGGLFYGPQSRLMPVHVGGGFVSIGVSFRPSACAALMESSLPALVDRVISVRPWIPADLLHRFDLDADPESWLCIVEDLVREHITRLNGVRPDPVSAHFEEIAFLDPSMSIAQAAREIDVDRRRLERVVVRDFGLSPKQVLKRARALDMASYLRGVADNDEGEALALRYYDESHLIREFIDLFGVSPRQFSARPQPLLTQTLEIRQARRLEQIKRLEPGARRPWE